MTHHFKPFTTELFKQQTCLDAQENEAIYIRWANTQINYANYLSMQQMTDSLQEIIALLKQSVLR